MTGSIRPLQLVPDIEHHAVTTYARMVAAACGCSVSGEPPSGIGAPLHLHFTERLWGEDPGLAAARIEALARRHPLTVTLHDLPQASDGPTAQPRREAAYAQVVAAAAGVVCNSVWESELLASFTAPRQARAVIPLAVQPYPGKPARGTSARVAPAGAASARVTPGLTSGSAGTSTIGLLGFIYPGKGHAAAIDAAATCARRIGRDVEVLAIGAVSVGHDEDAGALGEQARAQGVAFSITGYLSEHELNRVARRVDVPLAAHEHVSASASIAYWLSAGRRPLVADSAYAREIDALRPGTIRRYDPGELDSALARALDDPPAGWLAPDVDLRPGPDEVAAAYLEWWTEEVSW